jgi:hypothetical protein
MDAPCSRQWTEGAIWRRSHGFGKPLTSSAVCLPAIMPRVSFRSGLGPYRLPHPSIHVRALARVSAPGIGMHDPSPSSGTSEEPMAFHHITALPWRDGERRRSHGYRELRVRP